MSPARGRSGEMSFLEHLEELRRAILKSVLAILIGMVLCFTFADYIINFLLSPTFQENLKTEIEIQAIRPAGMFTARVNISLLLGFALVLPYVLYQLWTFISPGLLDKEKKYVPLVIFFCCVLFLVGAAFAFYVLIPVMVRFFVQLHVPDIKPQWDIGFYIGLVNKMVLIMGVVFQMPAVVAFLTWLRILNAGVLKRVWRIALVVIFIAAAVITPTGDPYTQTLVAIPLVVLYFISMGIAALIGRSRRKAEEAKEEEEGDDDGDGGGEGGGGDDDGERPALTTGEPDTPTLPRDSSTPAGEQRTGRGYWPDDDEFIYDYDVEMGYSEEPEDKADESDRDDRKGDSDPADGDKRDQDKVETDENGGDEASGDETSGDDSSESDETGESGDSNDAGKEDQQDGTDSDRSDDDKKN
ncbi:MAG: twin-arginine translocase subunit TatC [Gemmatimonadetes bacterium]|nr:twin-arginine translocase subunit TatC [Gemmatimonadota bacterium]MYD25286.1 twin-arginine translocase subunit TatC [Gemmatimonadota bacterium]MYJ00481.1 twin-arginine translocase subunit TatC [Gemmatimonadota bacterium]